MRERIDDIAGQAADTYKVARRGMRRAYKTASDYPGTIAAVVVGLAITGLLVRAARRAGGWRNLQDQAKDRAREMYRERFTGSSSPAPIAE